jgi:hypothetical protein
LGRHSSRRRRQSGDLAFGESEVHTADPRGLATTVDVRDACRLRLIDNDRAQLDSAAEQPRDFRIRHEAERRAQHIARERAHGSAIGQRHLAQHRVAARGHDPRARDERRRHETGAKRRRLRERERAAPQPCRETHDVRARRLLRHEQHLRSVAREIGCDRQQQWSGPGNHDAPSTK